MMQLSDDDVVRAMTTAEDPLLKILGEVMMLQRRKANDYNGTQVSRDEYWPFGLKSFVQMLWTKVLRLRSLIADGRVPANESIEDTAKDLIVYSLFMIEWMRRQ